jgi:ParB-like chromosome segregation protein Spo0J
MRIVRRAMTVRKAARALPEVTVAVAEIEPTQCWVHRSAVADIMADIASLAGAKEPAIAVRKGGKLWLYDGHHRLAASVLSGAPTLCARLIDFD